MFTLVFTPLPVAPDSVALLSGVRVADDWLTDLPPVECGVFDWSDFRLLEDIV
jgi:hypothetical protein